MLELKKINDLNSGVGYGITDEDPPEYYDVSSGWYCAGDPTTGHMQGVEFASDCVAIFLGEHLVAIWMRPDNWMKLSLAVGVSQAFA